MQLHLFSIIFFFLNSFFHEKKIVYKIIINKKKEEKKEECLLMNPMCCESLVWAWYSYSPHVWIDFQIIWLHCENLTGMGIPRRFGFLPAGLRQDSIIGITHHGESIHRIILKTTKFSAFHYFQQLSYDMKMKSMHKKRHSFPSSVSQLSFLAYILCIDSSPEFLIFVVSFFILENQLRKLG